MSEEKMGIAGRVTSLKEKVSDKIVGGVASKIGDRVEQVGDKIVSGVESTIENIVERFKKLEEITGIELAEIEVSFEATGNLSSIVSLLGSAEGKGAIKIKLQRIK